MESICRMFLWSGKSASSKKTPIAWDRMCDPKNYGGLNITSLTEWNQATMFKLLWNIQGKKDKLWVKWLDAYYVKGGDFKDWSPPQDCSWILKRIVKSKNLCVQQPDWKITLAEEKFVISKHYHRLRGDKKKVDWYTVFFHNMARPRAKLQLWMLLMGRLTTRDKLRRFGLTKNPSCVFCTEPESIAHLYFQ